tara:strand:- start:580 stop:4389 length:3810 start_codon:yes stop_codon:yes gene_type:complete
MALFLSQIEKPIKKELYRRINLSSHGYERTATPGNILDPVKMDESRHWFSRRKPWIRFTSGGLVHVEGDETGILYSEAAAMQNILFGGILNTNIISKQNDDSKVTDANQPRVSLHNFSSTGLKGKFEDSYIGKRRTSIAGITGITVQNKGDLGSIREAEIKWTCWDEEQFETLQKLYMTPGVSCLLEWGWSLDSTGNIINMDSSFFNFVSTPNKAMNEETNPYAHAAIKTKVMSNNGCYDACVGMIHNFDWSFNKETGAYDCSTKLTAPGDSLLGMELGRGEEGIELGDLPSSEWFTAKSFQPYISGGGMNINEDWAKDTTVKLESDVSNLKDFSDKICFVGNMLNCTDTKWAADTGAPANGQLDRQAQSKFINVGDETVEQKLKAGTSIRQMEYAEISRYYGWSDYSTVGEDTFIDNIKNTPKSTGAFWYDGSWTNNSNYITWAFFEEILINQFFCPRKTEVDEKPAVTTTDMMMMRSCNIIDWQTHDQDKFYRNLAKHNKWGEPKNNETMNYVYESVRIGMHPDLVSVDGGVMWIPDYPDISSTSPDSVILGNYDHFMVSKYGCGGPEKDSTEGYLRNILINTKAITESFSGANTVEDGIKKLLGKMNEASVNYWNLTLQCDEIDGGTRLKVIDANWVEKSVKELMKKSEQPLGMEDVAFTFPIYSNNSISSGLTMTSKLPDSMKSAIFIGTNKYSKSTDTGAGPNDSLQPHLPDVVDRYHYFGPRVIEEKTKDDKEKEQKRKDALDAKKLKELKEAKKEKATSQMNDKMQSKTKDYVRTLLQLDEKTDYNQYNNNRMLPVDLSLTLDGLAGIYFGNVFSVSKLPKTLDKNILFQVKNVTHTVDNNTWTTAIDSICRLGRETDRDTEFKDQERFINESREEQEQAGVKKYNASEEKRKKNEEKENNADSVTDAEQASSGKGEGADIKDNIAKNVKAGSGDLGGSKEGEGKDINLDNKNKDGSNKSDTRKDKVEAQIQPGAKTDLTKEEEELLEDTTPAEQAELYKDELKDKSIPILTPWFDEATIPSAAGLGGRKLYSGPEQITLFSELKLFGGGDIKLSVAPESHTKTREDLVVAAYEICYNFEDRTTDNEMDEIIATIKKYHGQGRLLMLLQTAHLIWIQKDMSSNVKDEDWNGNIFKWIWYETKAFRGKAPTAGTSSAKQRKDLSELLKGIAFFEINTIRPSTKKNDVKGRRFEYGQEGHKGPGPDLPTSGNNPEWYPWGPQSAYENGFYYYTGQVGESDQLSYKRTTNSGPPIDFQDYKDLYQ